MLFLFFFKKFNTFQIKKFSKNKEMSSEDPAARAAALFRNQNTRVSDIVSDISVVQFFTPQNPEATML